MTEQRDADRSDQDPPPFTGPERRSPETRDRRLRPRGGRRATDTFRRLADFAYKLLTEPPR